MKKPNHFQSNVLSKCSLHNFENERMRACYVDILSKLPVEYFVKFSVYISDKA